MFENHPKVKICGDVPWKLGVSFRFIKKVKHNLSRDMIAGTLSTNINCAFHMILRPTHNIGAMYAKHDYLCHTMFELLVFSF